MGFLNYGRLDRLSNFPIGTAADPAANVRFADFCKPDNLLFVGGVLRVNMESPNLQQNEAPYWKKSFVQEIGHSLFQRHGFGCVKSQYSGIYPLDFKKEELDCPLNEGQFLGNIKFVAPGFPGGLHYRRRGSALED